MGKIHLNNIIFHATHGVHPEESVIGTYFSVDLILTANFTSSYTSDDLEDTVNYQLIYELIAKEMETPSKLIEHLMARIAKAIKKQVSYEQLSLKITKHYPPVKGLNSVSVSDLF